LVVGGLIDAAKIHIETYPEHRRLTLVATEDRGFSKKMLDELNLPRYCGIDCWERRLAFTKDIIAVLPCSIENTLIVRKVTLQSLAKS